MKPRIRIPTQLRPKTWRCRIPSASRCASTETRQWSTPLAGHLAGAIRTTGPISLAAYMRQCLTSPHGGYYTTSQSGRDQFGHKGDFITSPEISQIFGELLGVWVVAEWMAQGEKSKGVELIELGPGRGTLMDDMLRAIRNFKPLASAIDAVHLVEASPFLREAQKQLLCGDAPMEETEHGYQSKSKHLGVSVRWTEDLRFVPNDPEKSPFIIAHEFFDALPIHAFQSVVISQPSITTSVTGLPPSGLATARPEWRELVVTPPPQPSAPSAPSTTPPPEFQLSISKSPTPHSRLLPQLSQRYSHLLSYPGSTIEISPEALSLAGDIARRIGGSSYPPPGQKTPTNPFPPKPRPLGAALILDYGPSDHIPVSSLRGIWGHKLVSPFSNPGLVDLSADVDFLGLAESALAASDGVEVHGPVEQGLFLEQMGGRERMAQLVRGLGEGDGEERKRIVGGWERLVGRGPGEMGRAYKVLTILPVGGRRPVGFGGDVRA